MGRHKEETVQTAVKLSLDNSFLKFYLTNLISWCNMYLSIRVIQKIHFVGGNPF